MGESDDPSRTAGQSETTQTHPPERRPGERAFALMLLVFSIFAFSQSYAISGFTGLTTGGVMPMLASGVMVISSLFIITRSFTRPARQASTADSVLGYLLPLPLVGFSVIVAVYAWLIPLLGFLAASGIFLYVSIWILWRNGPLYTLLIASVAIAAIHVLFRMVFQVVLPIGTLWQ